MPASSSRPTRKPALAWTRLSDEELLNLRFCDLKLTLAGSSLERRLNRINDELERRGIRFRPHMWLAEEWFSPDGVPGIAVPFYLAHPRLRRLERRLMKEVEGGNSNWLMRILRHEAGHAIDTAYRLRRRARWREVFGPASLPYPQRYRARTRSRRYVQHLGDWYAQSHPTEDFAETFAVWLKPNSDWRRTYASWPAWEKLSFVDEVMHEVSDKTAPVRTRVQIEPLRENQRTLAEHYRERLARQHSWRSRRPTTCCCACSRGAPRAAERCAPRSTCVATASRFWPPCTATPGGNLYTVPAAAHRHRSRGLPGPAPAGFNSAPPARTRAGCWAVWSVYSASRSGHS
jgi:hypothetical protein